MGKPNWAHINLNISREAWTLEINGQAIPGVRGITLRDMAEDDTPVLTVEMLVDSVTVDGEAVLDLSLLRVPSAETVDRVAAEVEERLTERLRRAASPPRRLGVLGEELTQDALHPEGGSHVG
jgi:hypothetical protein